MANCFYFVNGRSPFQAAVLFIRIQSTVYSWILFFTIFKSQKKKEKVNLP